MLHCVQNLHNPFLYKDWDSEDAELPEYKQMWGEVKKEMLGLIVLNGLENLLMMIPLVYTGMLLSTNLVTAIVKYDLILID